MPEPMTLGGEAVAVPYPQVQPVARLKIYSNRHTHTHTRSQPHKSQTDTQSTQMSTAPRASSCSPIWWTVWMFTSEKIIIYVQGGTFQQLSSDTWAHQGFKCDLNVSDLWLLHHPKRDDFTLFCEKHYNLSSNAVILFA